jgi:hypothetical protein
MRFRLRTLLIVLALGPPLIWGGYLGWERIKPKPPPLSPWYITENINLRLPEREGYRWKLTREHGLVQVPDAPAEMPAGVVVSPDSPLRVRTLDAPETSEQPNP